MHQLEAIPFPAMLWKVESNDPGDTRLVYCNQRSMDLPGGIHRHLNETVREFVPATISLPREFNTPEATLRVVATGVPEYFARLPFQDPSGDLPPNVYDIWITRWDAQHALFCYTLKNLPEYDFDALFRIERRLRMLDHLPGYVLTLDNDGVLVDVNKTSTAYHDEHFLGKKQWEAGLPEANIRIKDLWSHFIAGDEEASVDVPGLPAGAWFRLWYRRLDPWTIICTVIDVTEEKKYEVELVERNLSLARSNEDLSQFAYAASHDLQEPLRTITSYLSIISEEMGPKLNAELSEYLSFVTGAAARMKELIEGLLQYSRVETRGEAMDTVPLSDNTDLLIKMFRTHPVQFEVEPLPDVVGGASQIRQVFENLINNSIRYRKPGTTAHVRIYHAGTSEGMHEIVVADDGIGIDPQYHDLIFLIFKRLHTRHEYEGTGIGLALVRRIIDRHGGTVWVDSREGEGAAFHFTLPAAP